MDRKPEMNKRNEILQMFDGRNCTDFKNLKQEVRAECCNLIEYLCITHISNQKLFLDIKQSTIKEDRKNKIDGHITTHDGKKRKFQFKVKLPTNNDHSDKLVFEICKNITNPSEIKTFEMNGRDFISEAHMYIGLSSDFKKISFYDYYEIKNTALKYTKSMLESGKRMLFGEFGCVRFTTENIKGKTYYKIMYFANKTYFKKLYKDVDLNLNEVSKLISEQLD